MCRAINKIDTFLLVNPSMTDWTRVYAYEKHTYVESFPVTSFLLAGVSNYRETVKDIQVGDVLDMEFEINKYDNSAIVIKNLGDTCGYVKKDEKEKVQSHVPCQVKVIDKRLVDFGKGIYSLRVDLAGEEK